MLSKQNIPEKKEKVIEYLNRNGPSLPIRISNSINLSLLFTSALLSEMYHDGSIKISHLKIGGSPLYFVAGQESQLDNFVNHLEKKEQEALDNLKKYHILEDSSLEPSHRVALRNIKDFAIMTKVNIGKEERIFWKFHALTKEDFEKKLKEVLTKKKPKEIKERQEKEEKTEKKEKSEVKSAAKSKKVRKKKKEEIDEKIDNYLKTNNLSIVKEIKQDDVFGIVSSKTQLGSLKFLVIVKNKKRISDADITLVLHEGQKNKTPILLLTPGKLTRKAQKYVEENQGYIVIKNVNL